MSTPGAGRTSTPVLAEVVRSGFVEGCHHGSVVLTGPDGAVAWSLGVVDRPMLPRSANKPMQTLGMLRAGLDLPPDLLALATSSHSGEPVHLDPLSPYERKIVHDVVAEEGMHSESEGEGPGRHIVVSANG